MAITYTDSRVGRVVVPSAFTSINVRTPVAGLSAFGIIALIGEADAGPATSATGEDVTQNFFTPDQLANVISKYTSGNLVDAFRAAAVASNDGNIVGAPTRIFLYKTNASTSATSSIPALGYASYGTLSAAVQGASGNLLSWDTDTATSAVQPTTGNFTYAPAGVTYQLTYRQRGSAAVSYTITANTSPASLASKTSSLQTSSFLVTGGSDRSAFSTNAGVTLSCVTSSGNVGTFTLGTGTFAATPVAGDIVEIPLTSVFVGSSTVNAGYWVVTSATNTSTLAQFAAVKLNNWSATTGVNAPINISTTFSASITTDMVCYQPLKFTDMSGVNRGSFVSLTASSAAFTANSGTAVLSLNNGSFSPVTSITRPRVSDALYIPTGSTFAGTGDANVGFYSISAVTDTSLSLSRLTNGNTITVASGNIGATPDSNLIVVRPYIDGQQSLLEISNGSAALSITRAFYNLGTTTSATFISSASAPYVVTGTDYQVSVSINRSSDNTQESYSTIGGHVSLELGYLGTSCSVVVSSTALTTVVAGGSGSNLTLTFSNFPTINDMVTYINQQTGYSAVAGSSAEGLLNPALVLDRGTFTAASSVAATAYPARIKRDAYDFAQALLGSSTVTLTGVATAGLPEASAAAALLAGGAKGGTTAAAFAAAVDALEAIDVNFIIPLFSQDATADIAAGLTDSSSTYTISGVNSYLLQHCNSLSGQVKRKKNRLGVGSFKGTFAQAKSAAASLASARYALAFQDVKNVSSQGVVVQYQPWMLATMAASMQSVGLYRSITRKYVAISGIVNPSGFNPGNYGQLEQALLGGLLVVEAPNGGGFRFVSDQTTYGKDDNFVYNSLQVMYTGDFMALDLAFSFDNFVVGQAIADVSQAVGLSFLQAKMSQYLQNKLISPSDGAPAGYDTASVTISGPVMTVGVNAYITNALYFVPITLNISKVTQSGQ